jgi:hypothetical protein
MNPGPFILAALALLGAACSRTPDAVTAAAPADDARPIALERRVREQADELAQLRSLLQEARAQQAQAEARLAAVPTNAAVPLLTSTPQGVTIATNNPLGQILQAVSTVMTNTGALRSFGENMRNAGRLRGRLYDDFIQQAGIDPARANELKALLQRRRSIEMRRAWVGDEETDRQLAVLNGQIRALTGDAAYAQLDLYDRQLPARMTADRFALFMEDRGTPLSSDSRSRLIGALAAVPGLSADGSPGFAAGFQPGGSRDLNQAVESQLDRTVERYDLIVAAAQPVLSSSENQALDEYLGARMQEQEVGAQFTRAIVPVFMGTNRPPAGPATTSVPVQPAVIETP